MMGKSRAEYMRNYRQKKHEEKLRTGAIKPKIIARSSTQRSRDHRARVKGIILSQTSTADPTTGLPGTALPNLVSHANLQSTSLPLAPAPFISIASVSNTRPAEIRPSSAYAEESVLAIPNTAKKILITSQPQKQPYISLQEQANDSTEMTLNIKEEPKEHTETNEMEKATYPVMEKDFAKSRLRKGKQSVNGLGQPKQARLHIPKFPNEYMKQLYEFGKYIAEQLWCLNVEDVRIAQTDIIAVLSKFTHKRIREPRKLKATKKSCMVEIEIEAVKPAVTSESSVNSTIHSQFSNFNPAGQTVSQTLVANITGSPVSQNVLGNIAGPIASQTPRVGPSNTRSRKVVGSKLTEVAVPTMKPGFSSQSLLLPFVVNSYSLPTSEPVLNIAPLERIEQPDLASSESISSTGSIVNQSFPNVIFTGSQVSQTSSPNMEFSEISVKTEPDSESTYNNVNKYESDDPSLNIKSEPRSDDET